jgi:DNA primase
MFKMAVSPEFIEDLRQRVPLSDVIGRRVKLVRKGRRHTGLCPFHSEKTPSFSVVDDDGFYHCFGCGVHGDAISFLRETDGLDFLEAVERLAEMAGVAVPRSAPQDTKKMAQRKAALDILEVTTRFFQDALKHDDGRDAARYVQNRGLPDQIISTYRLGYAPRNGLRAALSANGFHEDDMLAAGVIRRSDRDGSLFDYFRDRVMFPIENRQGKVIAFGARALGDAQPKYLNSGEGPTFAKKAVLYGWVQAREALRRNLPLVVAEGYMDVIAIHQSGVAAAVAPLGTALTEEQIGLLWKLHDEPILCFDGDGAGQRAQMRALERILPLLTPGKSARLAVLPAGKDPDDLLREAGSEGFSKVLATARSLVDSLWDGIAAQHDVRQPEARAQFWQEVRNRVRLIAHNQVRSAYGDEIETRISAMRNAGRQQGGMMQMRRAAVRRPSTGMINRHRAILALLLAHPELIASAYEQLLSSESGDAGLESLKKAMIDAVIGDPDLDVEALTYHLNGSGMSEQLAALVGDEMKARLGCDPKSLSSEEAGRQLEELLNLVSGKSGVFSTAAQSPK